MDMYYKMGTELRELFRMIFHKNQHEAIQKQMGDILHLARQIGGAIQEDAEKLNADVSSYLENPNDPSFIEVMNNHALKLEQQTREI